MAGVPDVASEGGEEMKITADDLLRKEACEDGVALFRKLYPDGFGGEWNREAQIKILRSPLRKHLAWAWNVGLVPMWSISNANLSNANLSYANLSNANLSNANLSNADLSNADLSNANLSNAKRLESDHKIPGWTLRDGILVRDRCAGHKGLERRKK